MTKLLAAALLLPLAVASASAPARAAERFKVLHVADLAKALRSKGPPAVFDANSQSTRERAGVIPGAKLLSDYDKYDVSKELPADKSKPLVFYCANAMCTASHSAAERALDAGYTDVSVMVDGIFGWKKAGRRTEKVAAAPPPAMDPRQAAGLVKDGLAVIVDVREAEERSLVIPGALWLPMSRVQDAQAWESFVAGLPKDKTVIFHCSMGGRAKKAAAKLAKTGRTAAYFKSPDQWKAEGLPVEPGPARAGR